MEVPNGSSKIEKKIQKNPKDIVRSSLILSLRQREVYPQEKLSGCCFCLSGLKCNTQETQEMSKGIIPAQSVTESVQNEYRQFRPRNSTTRKQDKKTTQQQPWLLFYREERMTQRMEMRAQWIHLKIHREPFPETMKLVT